MKAVIKRSQGFRGEIRVPGDKSICHRAALIGALGSGFTEIVNFLEADDCLATIVCLQKLGVEIFKEKGHRTIIKGKNLFGFRESETVLDAQNSGTTARFLLGLLSGQSFFSVVTGDASLRQRPMKRVVDPLRRMGAVIDGRKDGDHLPLAVRGQTLRGLSHRLSVPSAQLKSALILASLLCEGEAEIEEPIPSRDHTERMLDYFGAGIKREKNLIRIHGRKTFQGKKILVPGDFSSASFFIAAAVLVENSSLMLPDVGINPTRTGLLRILMKMGGQIRIQDKDTICQEPVGTLIVSSSRLKGVRIAGDEIPALIDEIPLIAILAAQAEGTTSVEGASELRVKESDRIAAVVGNLRKMGVNIEEREDGFVLEGPQRLKGTTVHSHGDHRVAMAMAVAGLVAEGETEIEGFSCFRTSFPQFYALIRKWKNG